MPARRGAAVIRLRRRLPGDSSDLTRGPAEPAVSSSYSVLLRVGFTEPAGLPAAGGLLPAPFHLRRACARLCLFCGTLLRVTPTGRYPAPCSAELGLSSTGRSRRDCLADSPTIVPAGSAGVNQPTKAAGRRHQTPAHREPARRADWDNRAGV